MKEAERKARAGRKPIGRTIKVKLGDVLESYAATKGASTSEGVRNCVERCMRLDMRKPIDLTKG